jgi:hypothetical protein
MSCSVSDSPNASESVMTIRSAAGMSMPLPIRLVAARIDGARPRNAFIISTRVPMSLTLTPLRRLRLDCSLVSAMSPRSCCTSRS